MAITDLLQTQTFRDWFNKTNEIIDTLNANTLVDGITANGDFSVNGSLLVVNTFFANASVVQLRGNTAFSANVTASTSCNVWNFAVGTLLIQPINGTIVNTALTVNATTTFLGGITANANVFITADVTQTGNTLITGTLTGNGAVIARQVLFAAANAQITPAALTSPQYDDFAPAAGDGAEVWNLTPSIDVVLTGIAAPTGFVTGSRILYIQNLATAFKLSFASANTSSGVNNRFKTPNDTLVDVPPGSAVGLIWSSTNKQWRLLSPTAAPLANLNVSGTLTIAGNTTIGGWGNVVGKLVVNGNTNLIGNTTLNGFLNVATSLQVSGNTLLIGNGSFGNTTITGWLNVSSTLQVASSLNVAGLSTLTGNTNFGGSVNVGTTLTVVGFSSFASAAFAGFVNTASTLQVAGLSTLASANLSGALTVAGLTTLSGGVIMTAVTMNGGPVAAFSGWNAGPGKNVSTLATTDLFIVVIANGSDTYQIFTDASNPPTTMRWSSQSTAFAPVKRGDYYKWNSTGPDTGLVSYTMKVGQ